MIRRVCYISGSRADFGLMESALRAIHASDDLVLRIAVTGSHLSEQHGMTVRDIERAKLPIGARIAVESSPATGATMGRNIARILDALVGYLLLERPDMVLLLGDRGEMLAAALAAIHLGVPVVHIHGGERSGTVDEPVRHAISKLSHFHLVATAQSRERIIRMGEEPNRVWVIGAPGLDGLENLAVIGREALALSVRLDSNLPIALMIYHPVMGESESPAVAADLILSRLLASGMQVVALEPNSDAGADEVRRVLRAYSDAGSVRCATHFSRSQFVSWMAAADLMVGNSSAGIIEAATFGTPVVNVGSRQRMRERNANVLDAPIDAAILDTALARARSQGRLERRNVYGDGATGPRIVKLLRTVPLGSQVLSKCNAY